MKPLALYLPQYHRIKENDEWWGDGYTEWTAVKNAIPYSRKQNQPRVPLNDNYYDLADEEAKAWKWQSDLAKEYHIYGFVIYHYWFETGKQLLERPMEILLRHQEIDLKYCVCWANESWRRTWYDTENEMLMEQKYGDRKEWISHFNYLLPFFRDERYIKLNNKPVLNIYHSAEIDCLPDMLATWNQLALDNGFDGLHVVSGNTGATIDLRGELFDAYYNFEPSYTLIHKRNKVERTKYLWNVFIRKLWNQLSSKKVLERPINGRKFLNEMLRDNKDQESIIYPGVFPQWDNSPRRKYKGTFFFNMGKYTFEKQVQYIKEKYKETEFMYINAWNEWGEGAYLEPDVVQKYLYLEVIKNEFATE